MILLVFTCSCIPPSPKICIISTLRFRLYIAEEESHCLVFKDHPFLFPIVVPCIYENLGFSELCLSKKPLHHRRVSKNICAISAFLGHFHKMTATALVRAAIFAAGALVGGGVATIISSKRQLPRPSPQTQEAIVALDEAGKTRMSGTVAPMSSLSTVLKYGNPGEVGIPARRPLLMYLFLTRPHRRPTRASSLRRCIRPPS